MARKAKFHFNPETLSYERIETTIRQKLQSISVQVLTGLFIGIIAFFLASWLVDSPKERILKQEISVSKNQYELLEKRVDQLQTVITDLQQRDDNLYRVVFQADPIPTSVRRGGFNNLQRYENLSGMTNSELIIQLTRQIDELSKEIYIQSKSYDELVHLAKNNEELLQHIPAIQPVLNKDLSRLASGYGMRIDPVYRVPRMHNGMDFTAPIGTEVFATGNGTIAFAGWKAGFGNCIYINHGFNYETIYAHLSAIKVREGEKVARGQVIGLVGNTGKSTGPHLHYEVHYRGVVQNPQNYYYLDLDPDEYDRMVQLSENSGLVFD